MTKTELKDQIKADRGEAIVQLTNLVESGNIDYNTAKELINTLRTLDALNMFLGSRP